MSKVMDRWNSAWDNSTITLVVCSHDKISLEGRTEKDRDLIRRATMWGRVRTNKQYDALLKIVSDWGYCVESPIDFIFLS